MLWGLGRIMPGDQAQDGLEPARIGVERGAVLAVFGPGLPGPLVSISLAHPGRIEAFEWREETIEELTDGVRRANFADRINVTKIDLEAHVWQPDMFDGIWCLDDFTYVGYAPHLAQQIFKSLKEGARAVIETYTGLPGEHIQPAFATAFAEPQIRAHGDLLQVFADAGFTLDADEDVTAEHLDLARTGFRNLRTVLADSHGLDPQTGREIAWEAQAWAVRMKFLAQRRLTRRRFTVRKDTLPPTEPEIEVRAREALAAALQASKTNAP
jgi:SAM-dependent methyltransferase